MNENETIADIRKEAEGMFRSLCVKYHITYLGILPIMQEFNHIFDRIEAAVQREVEDAERRGYHAATKAVCETLEKVGPLYDEESIGNSAKLREALVSCMDYFQRIDHPMNDYMRGLFETAYNKTTAALAAPPRNCDVGTADEQRKRQHDTMCNTTKACPDSDWSCKKCFSEWAQMPYEAKPEKKGE